MTRRKDEIWRADLRRKWPHHVAQSADKVRGLANSQVVCGSRHTPPVAPLTYSVSRADVDLVVFSLAKPEDADAFSKQFGGERLGAHPGPGVPNSSASAL